MLALIVKRLLNVTKYRASGKCWGARSREEAAISTPGKSPAVLSNGEQKLVVESTEKVSLSLMFMSLIESWGCF